MRGGSVWVNGWLWKFISCLERRFIRKTCIFIIKENMPVVINSWPPLTLTMYPTPSKVLYLHGFTVKRIVNVTQFEMRYIFLSLFGLWRKQGRAAGKWQSDRGHSASKSDILSPPANAGDLRDAGSIPGLRSSPGEGHGNLLQYSCLKNAMDREASRATSL